VATMGFVTFVTEPGAGLCVFVDFMDETGREATSWRTATSREPHGGEFRAGFRRARGVPWVSIRAGMLREAAEPSACLGFPEFSKETTRATGSGEFRKSLKARARGGGDGRGDRLGGRLWLADSANSTTRRDNRFNLEL